MLALRLATLGYHGALVLSQVECNECNECKHVQSQSLADHAGDFTSLAPRRPAQIETVVHTLLSTSIAAAVCVCLS